MFCLQFVSLHSCLRFCMMRVCVIVCCSSNDHVGKQVTQHHTKYIMTNLESKKILLPSSWCLKWISYLCMTALKCPPKYAHSLANFKILLQPQATTPALFCLSVMRSQCQFERELIYINKVKTFSRRRILIWWKKPPRISAFSFDLCLPGAHFHFIEFLFLLQESTQCSDESAEPGVSKYPAVSSQQKGGTTSVKLIF